MYNYSNPSDILAAYNQLYGGFQSNLTNSLRPGMYGDARQRAGHAYGPAISSRVQERINRMAHEAAMQMAAASANRSGYAGGAGGAATGKIQQIGPTWEEQLKDHFAQWNAYLSNPARDAKIQQERAASLAEATEKQRTIDADYYRSINLNSSSAAAAQAAANDQQAVWRNNPAARQAIMNATANAMANGTYNAYQPSAQATASPQATTQPMAVPTPGPTGYTSAQPQYSSNTSGYSQNLFGGSPGASASDISAYQSWQGAHPYQAPSVNNPVYNTYQQLQSQVSPSE